MATLKEKIGYGFGDMSSSMFWKIFSFYFLQRPTWGQRVSWYGLMSLTS